MIRTLEESLVLLCLPKNLLFRWSQSQHRYFFSNYNRIQSNRRVKSALDSIRNFFKNYIKKDVLVTEIIKF